MKLPLPGAGDPLGPQRVSNPTNVMQSNNLFSSIGLDEPIPLLLDKGKNIALIGEVGVED